MAEFARGRVGQWPSLLGAEMSRNPDSHALVCLLQNLMRQNPLYDRLERL